MSELHYKGVQAHKSENYRVKRRTKIITRKQIEKLRAKVRLCGALVKERWSTAISALREAQCNNNACTETLA